MTAIIHLIASVLKANNAIGYQNNLLFQIKQDMQFFKNITQLKIHDSDKNAVIMGRKTWESIPDKNKPLINRTNIIITENNYSEYTEKYSNQHNILIFNNLEKCYKTVQNNYENIFVIGGCNIYKYYTCNRN